MSTKKVPCTTAAAGAPRTSFVSAVDEVARTPPGRVYPDIHSGRTSNPKQPEATGFLFSIIFQPISDLRAPPQMEPSIFWAGDRRQAAASAVLGCLQFPPRQRRSS